MRRTMDTIGNPEAAARSLGRNDPCWCGSGRKYKKCHLRQDRQSAPRERSARAGRTRRKGKILLKSPEQIEGIRRAGRLTRQILTMLEERIAPGVTTGQIDEWVAAALSDAGADAATRGYKGFPGHCCTSVNEVVCHGIPGPRVLSPGDIVNVDVTSVLDGFYGDANQMYLLGEVDEEARRLVDVTRECLEVGIAAVRPGGRLGEVGHAIQTHAEGHGYSVVRQFGGHGVGLAFHEEPHVPHHGERRSGPRLLPGMVFTIEPMINRGYWEVDILADGWTAVTQDGSLSAQFEHTVAVTSDGVDVLTL